MMEKSETMLTLIRHGLSDFNVDGRFQGSGDLAQLSDLGIEQANLVGEALSGHPIDVIYASRLLRARQTAEIIAKVVGHRHPIQFDDRLREVDIPDWQGLRHSEIQQGNPILHNTFYERPEEFEVCSNGKSRQPLLDLYHRVSEFMRERVYGSNSRILVASHLGTSQALINVALGLSVSSHHRIQQSQCAVSRLEFGTNGTAELTKLNETGHLGQALPKIKSQKRGARIILMGFAKEANFEDFDFSLLGDQENAFWVESALEDNLFLPNQYPSPKSFNITGNIHNGSISRQIKQLKMSRDLSSMLIAVRSDSLPEVVEGFFEMPRVLVGSAVNAQKVTLVVHESSEHGKPIIQMLNRIGTNAG